MATKGVLLLNLGTPEEPTAKGLRKFYKYFFSDPFVFDFNAVGVWTCTNSCFDESQTTCVREEEVFVASDGIDQSILAKLAAAK